MVLSPVMGKCILMLIAMTATCFSALIHHMLIKLK